MCIPSHDEENSNVKRIIINQPVERAYCCKRNVNQTEAMINNNNNNKYALNAGNTEGEQNSILFYTIYEPEIVPSMNKNRF